MDLEIQWENPAHFLLDRNKNKDGISIQLFEVKTEKAAVWFDPQNQTAVPVKKRAQTPLSFEVLTIDPVPALLVLSFQVSYKDSNFDERLLSVVQLLEFKDSVLRAVAWLPVLPIGAVELSAELPRSFDFTRKSAHPLITSVVAQGSGWTVKISTIFLDVTNLWWKAIERNTKNAGSLFTEREKYYLFDAYNRWYKDHIAETGCKVAVLASTASAPPLIWFVLIPQKCLQNTDNQKIFSQLYYRPAGWKPEGNWHSNVNDIIGQDRLRKIMASLLWSIMSPVKVLEESSYNDRRLTAHISDRFKLVPTRYSKEAGADKLELMIGEGLWSPQRIAASLNESGTCQLVFLPIRHDVNNMPAEQVLFTATQPNLHVRLRTAVNVLWCMSYVSSSTPDLSYDDDFVVAGYSLGGFTMWAAAQNNLDKVKALIAVEPGGVAYDPARLKSIVDGLIKLKRKIFFVGRYKTYGDMGEIWKKRGADPAITYMPDEKGYDDFLAHKPVTTTNEWLKYVFTGLKKRDDEKFDKNGANKEPHPEPDIPLGERKAINKLKLSTDNDFAGVIPHGSWFGIPVLHLFAMCGGRVFKPPKLDAKGIVTADAEYKTFYQECMELL